MPHTLDLSALDEHQRALIREQVLTVLRVEAHDIRDVLPTYTPGGSAHADMAGWLAGAEAAIAAPPGERIELAAVSPMLRLRIGDVALRSLHSLCHGAEDAELDRLHAARTAVLAFCKAA